MSAIQELRFYVRQLQTRFRLGAVVRGSALLAAAALVATVVLTLIINRFAFSSASLWSARAALLLTLALGAAFGLAIPLWRLSRRWWTRAERAFPQFEQRLMTFTERDRESRDPFLELLAADTLKVARTADVKGVAPDATLIGLLALGVSCLATLIWLVHAGPGYLGYGASALWKGAGPAPFYDVRVSPGDRTVRRHADQLVTAQLVGLQTDQLRIHVRYRGASKWEEVAMQPRPTTSGFQFLFAGIPDDVEYYVEAGSVQSAHFHLLVADVAAVKQIRVTYRHPDWMNLADTVEEHGGDLRAVEGTQAHLEIVTDRPLSNGVLVLDDGRQIALERAGTVYRGTINMEKDGSYHVASPDQALDQRITEDYFIEASAVKPPEVALVRPDRDYRASPIEEVTLAATASDPFGLSEFTLHYSVNGGPDKTVALMKSAAQSPAQKASGTTMLSLESLHLVPGDVVGFYAAAKDARSEAHTDIAFIQVDPFEREFSQSQQSGGGGGGGGTANDQAQIAEREKEIIAATWKQVGLKNASAQAAEQAKFLSDVQTTLRAQALALSGRLQMRDLQLANEQFGSFQQDMEAAAAAMQPAAQKLDTQQWSSAVSDEQKALQHLMRAEATFRQIEVAFGSRGGGGGAVNSAGRDLASLFDLELDTQKNQYETAQTASPESQRAAQIDDALHKLDELARRQNELAAQNSSDAEQAAEERWQQEMLRRKADELRQQMEQLARNGGQPGGAAGGKSAAGQSSGQSSGKSSGKSGGQPSGQSKGASSGQSAANTSAQKALERLRQAEEDMRRAVDEHNTADARRAADRLREAMNLLGGIQKQDASKQLDDLAGEAAKLANRQREQAQRIRGILSSRGGQDSTGRSRAAGYTRSEVEAFIDERQKLADDLARLTDQLRSAERATQERSHDAATQIRDALGDLEQADTETQLQRSADLLRRGYGPLTDDAENEIASELQHLKDQLGQARQAMADGQPSSDGPLDSVERLRSRLAALDRNLRGSGQSGSESGRGQSQSDGQNGGRGGPPSDGAGRGDLARGDAARGDGARGDAMRGDASRGAGARGDTTAGDPQSGALGGLAGPVRGGGGNRGGPVDGGWNAGNNSELPRPVAPDTSVPRGDSIQVYQAGINELGKLRRAVGDDPESRRQVDELIRAMQKLDPKRFPGNPAMVDELYARVVSGVDKLELQLRHEPQDAQPGQVRSESPLPMPPGYQAAVAEYFRRLSKNP